MNLQLVDHDLYPIFVLCRLSGVSKRKRGVIVPRSLRGRLEFLPFVLSLILDCASFNSGGIRLSLWCFNFHRGQI
jgi:hypothetical protein